MCGGLYTGGGGGLIGGEIGYEFSWFKNNKSSTIKDMETLSTKVNCACVITLQAKFQPPLIKGERRHSFLVGLYSMMKYKIWVSNVKVFIVFDYSQGRQK